LHLETHPTFLTVVRRAVAIVGSCGRTRFAGAAGGFLATARHAADASPAGCRANPCHSLCQPGGTDRACLRERSESRAAWLGIQAEAARLDAATAANWPTLTGQLAFSESRSLSSSGVSNPTLHRYGPSLSLAYVLYDFGARAASIDAQRYQLIASLLNNNRVLQDVVAEVEAAYYALLRVQAQVEALTQLEISCAPVLKRPKCG